ncbi:MAG: beta-lactamase family protein [Gemmatimonadetes bacterium]|nr:beta-lactamase family protein [Gemmatimonadota bacterium]
MRGAMGVLLVVTAACGGDHASPTATPAAPLPPLTVLLDSIRLASDLPALGAAIVTSGGVAQLEVVGVRRYGGRSYATRDDRWHLGSTLKHQVAVLVARLVADGTLSWSTTLPQFFPELAATMRPEYRAVTLRDLLSHTSALPRDYVSGLGDARAARAAVVRWAAQQPPVATPGTYAYSNINYMVAGAIVERALDQDFERVIAERLWAPLGMARAGFGQAGTAGADDEPLGHTVQANGARATYDAATPGADNPVEYGPAGRAHMPLADWARFISALLAAEQGRDTPVLSSQGWRALTAQPYVTTGSDGYGYGMVIATRTWSLGRALFHDGTNTRHYALVGVAPGRDFAILIVSNQWSASMGATMDRIFGRLVDFHLRGR